LYIVFIYPYKLHAQGNYNPFNTLGGQYGSALQPGNSIYQLPEQQYQKILQEQEQQKLKNTSDLQYKEEKDKLFNTKQKPYYDALQILKDMLSGKKKLSVADAYFIIENTYGSNYLTHKEYNDIFKKSVDFINVWMIENKLSIKNRDDVNNTLQKFMSEKLTTTKVTGTIETGFSTQITTHQPYFYDFNDFDAQKDHRSSFVTKIIATGGGQCASMPIVYIALAQMLDVKAYLSYAPNHSFVKYLNNKGVIENYEPTSNWKINDNWYIDDMFINEDAIKSGLYLDTMNYQQIVADCVIQLADYYARNFGVNTGIFVQQCIDVASMYFPKNNNIELCNLRMQVLKMKLADAISYARYKYNHSVLTDEFIIANDHKAKKLYQEIKAIEEHKRQLGFDEQPKGLYEEMMKHQEFGGKRQIFKGIDGTQKQNLFKTKKISN
jgi:hypothetical protein